jgi:hypothetical protein
MKRQECGLLALPCTVPVEHAVLSVHCEGDSQAKPYADQFMLCKVLEMPRKFCEYIKRFCSLISATVSLRCELLVKYR